MEPILKRLSEPSTWAGLGGLAVILGISMDEFNQYVVAITGGLGFILSVVFAEKGGQ